MKRKSHLKQQKKSSRKGNETEATLCMGGQEWKEKKEHKRIGHHKEEEDPFPPASFVHAYFFHPGKGDCNKREEILRNSMVQCIPHLLERGTCTSSGKKLRFVSASVPLSN